MASPSVLVAFEAPSVGLHAIGELLAGEGLTSSAAAVATSSGSLSPESLGKGAYDVVVSTATHPGHHGIQLLGALAAAVKPGGTLVVRQPAAPPAAEDELRRALLLAGLPDAAPATGWLGTGEFALRAVKPAWQTGARAAISIKPRAAVTAPAAAAAWGLGSLNDGLGDGDEDLVDEDTLLTEEDAARPAPPTGPSGGDDCEVGAGGRKACKDCTCGRAEGGGPPAKLTPEMIENPTSGCGSCSLGDAFRCGGCPYRGLPAFELGKRIELPADFLVQDA